VIETASVLTALRGTTYLGSHPRATRRLHDVDIEFTEAALSMRRGRRKFGWIPWASVTALSAATWDTEARRIFWPTVFFVGWLWAWLTMSRTTYSYLTVTDSEGEWAFAVPGLTASELQVGVEALQVYVPPRLLT
jgi:hypothetical protein